MLCPPFGALNVTLHVIISRLTVIVLLLLSLGFMLHAIVWIRIDFVTLVPPMTNNGGAPHPCIGNTYVILGNEDRLPIPNRGTILVAWKFR